MKKIALTKGKHALVDDEDYEWLSQWKWHCVIIDGVEYAERNSYGDNKEHTLVRMHRQIMGLLPGDKRQVDHINGKGLHNMRSNLRVCNNQQNHFNCKRHRDNNSGFIGVGRYKGKWRARVVQNYRDIHLGYFDDPVSAAMAYNEFVSEHRGEFAKLNKIPSPRNIKSPKQHNNKRS